MDLRPLATIDKNMNIGKKSDDNFSDLRASDQALYLQHLLQLKNR